VFPNATTRPRTKQTAKKSTGAPAPAISLSHVPQLSQPPPKKRRREVEQTSPNVKIDIEPKENFEIVLRGSRIKPGDVSNPLDL